MTQNEPDAGMCPAMGFDTTTPSTARIYNYWLGGKDHFAADRKAAKTIQGAFPHVPKLAKANRRFLASAVRFCVRQGIDQVIDIGTGIPAPPTVIDIARKQQPAARMVGVDNDPVVLAHDRALVETADEVRIVDGDLRHPRDILNSPVLGELIDLRRPVMLILVAVLHFVTEAECASDIVRTFREAMASGSYLVLSHATSSGSDPATVACFESVYAKATSPAVFRTDDQIRLLFDGFDLVEPGLVDVQDWPKSDGLRTDVRVLGGVGWKR
jgi:S-adenosyl methyltransferase